MICEMNGNQFRTLTVGNLVCWKNIDNGPCHDFRIAWSVVSMDWDDGHSTSIQRNDMARVEKVK
jgi:hypothetical protein